MAPLTEDEKIKMFDEMLRSVHAFMVGKAVLQIETQSPHIGGNAGGGGGQGGGGASFSYAPSVTRVRIVKDEQ